MTARLALVVTFDQLPASILGCYGNEWIETPHLDRLAAEGFVADQCWAAHIGPTAAETAFAAESCFASLAARRVQTSVLLEEASQTLFPLTGPDARAVVSREHGPSTKPDRIPLAELVRAAKLEWDSLGRRSRSGVIWMHARGLEIPALPPAGFAELYQDEFEDRGVRFDSLSEAEREFHPIAAAGMASLFDHWLGELYAVVHSSDQPVLTIVTAAAGARWQPWPNSFGEFDALRSQMAHVPLIVQANEPKVPMAVRSSQLLSPRCLQSLLDWWFDESDATWSDWLAKNSAAQIMTRTTSNAVRVTTKDWSAIFPAASPDGELKPLLFHKPEDYWEVNNQADALPETIEALLKARLWPPME